MNRTYRFVVALIVVLSGWALVPLVALPNQAIGWELFANAYSEVFLDGFESGDTSWWSQTVPPASKMVFLDSNSGDSFRAWLLGDRSILTQNPNTPVTLLVGMSSDGNALFGVDARLSDDLVYLRLRARADDGSETETPWRAISETSGFIEVEWRRAHGSNRDGELVVAVNDRLMLWLVDLNNHSEDLGSIGFLHFRGKPVLRDVTDGGWNR